MAALFPKMKPMLQFTTLPPPVEEKRRRRRRPVKTPSNPRVKAVHLQDEEAENWPDGCLKWVSPQFRRINYNSSSSSSDEELSTCDEDAFLRHHTNGRNMKRVPLEIKELFPDKQRKGNGGRIQKKTTRISTRKALRECTDVQQSDSNSHVCRHLSQDSQRFIYSQDISLYPSTCKVWPSKYISRTNRGRIISENGSIANGGHQLECVDDSKESSGVDVCVPIGVNLPTVLSQTSNQRVPEQICSQESASSGLQLRLSYSTTQHSSAHTTCTSETNEVCQNEKDLHSQSEIESKNEHSAHTCHIKDSILCTDTDDTHTNIQETALAHTNYHKDLTNASSMTNHPTQHQDSKVSKHNTDNFYQDHTRIADSIGSTCSANTQEPSSVCVSTSHNVSGGTRTIKAKTSGGCNNNSSNSSFMDMGELSALVANMSLDYNDNQFEFHSKDDRADSNDGRESEMAMVGVCGRLSTCEVHPSSVCAGHCSNVCVDVAAPPPSLLSLSVFEVTSFKPPCASTPFRDKPHTEARPFPSIHKECGNSNSVSQLDNTCKSTSCKPFVQDAGISVKGSPAPSFVNHFGEVKSVKPAVHTPVDMSTCSCLAYETPEHLWCSPRLRLCSKLDPELPHSRPTVDESLIHVPQIPNNSTHVHESGDNETSGFQFQNDCKMSSCIQHQASQCADGITSETSTKISRSTCIHIAQSDPITKFDHSSNENEHTSYSIPSLDHFHDFQSEDFDSDATRLSLDCESFAVYSHMDDDITNKHESILAEETPEHLWTATKSKTGSKSGVGGACTFSNDTTMSVDGSTISRIEGTMTSSATPKESNTQKSFVPLTETKTLPRASESKDLKCSSVRMSILAAETPEHLWSSQRVKPEMSYTEADRSNTNAMSIIDDVSKIEPTFEQSMSSKQSDSIPFNAHHTQCPTDGDSCTSKFAIAGSIAPVAQGQVLVSQACVSLNVDSSILAQETPEYMWLSPVVKVIGDSFV